VTLINAVVGFVAGVVAFTDPRLAARLVLLAAIVDALDGIIARSAGNSDVGPLLDSITDIVSFGTTPGLFVYGIVRLEYGGLGDLSPLVLAVALLVPAGFAAFSILRTAFYEGVRRRGRGPPRYPERAGRSHPRGGVPLGSRSGSCAPQGDRRPSRSSWSHQSGIPNSQSGDAFALGVIQALAIIVPSVFQGIFPIALLVAAMAYLTLGPFYYWGPSNGSVDNAP